MANDFFLDRNLTDYLASMRRPLPEPLASFEKDVRDRGLPVCSPGALDFLRMICALRRPRRILEIGTCVGFSACVMASECDACVDTVERNPVMIEEATCNIAAYFPGRITLYSGDAAAILPDLSGPYDLIFLDAAKGQYPTYYPHCKRLLAEGGVLIVDDVLFRGMVSDGKPDVHRNQTIVNRLRQFLTDLTSDPDFISTILPVSDGLAVSVKRTKGAAHE